MKDQDLTIAEVAYMCGFTTGQYFATVFKKHEKCSPNEYRLKSRVHDSSIDLNEIIMVRLKLSNVA